MIFHGENFKWLSAKNVNVGNAPVNAMRVNFVGEVRLGTSSSNRISKSYF